MVTFHPINFHGYVQPAGHPAYQYAHISQKVEYSESTSLLNKKIFSYKGSERELMFLLKANDTTFHKLLEKTPGARIIRTISNEPILTTQEQLLVEHGLELLSYYGEKQLLRENGRPVLDEYGLLIYVKDRLFLSGENMADQDLRIEPCEADLVDGEPLFSTSETDFFDFEG